MILPNKILLFLMGCMVVVPCFGAGACLEPNACTNLSNCTCSAENSTTCSVSTIGGKTYNLSNCTKITVTKTNVACGDGNSNCEETTETTEGTIEQEVCKEGYYISTCGGGNFSFESVMQAIREGHSHLHDNCWAINGSLKTEDNYKNMRALFDFATQDVADRIFNMDSESKTKCVDDSTDNNKSLSALTEWLNAISNACLNAVESTNSNLGYVCKKCPDDGKTLEATVYGQKLRATRTNKKNNSGGFVGIVFSFPTVEKIDDYWVSFNTIANCFITGGADERGNFILNESGTENKCYYSKE